ncbi:MAG: 2-oxoacid:ferredoxin oxidoreductase subunit beta [Deferribacteraceae bacterium]|jgi:2-oxoglutarate ferredoxin oxidoreductase subunit beta|nr:2-oxoacid:ferredoxin oxidoreductase subunit beta [Deferribacteraceae bacterium]
MSFDYDKYLRPNKLPHIWCPGCGYGIILKALIRALDSLGWDKDEVVIASGIGCASRLPGYVDFNTIHTTHGRSLAFATGIKLAKSNLKVIVLGGDGDMSAIGGNHLIHACRRNIDLSLMIFNNNIYGMTGGQFSPTTPTGQRATTAPYTMTENNFDISRLAIGAGASFVARTSTYHVVQMEDLMKQTFMHKGFSVLEIMSGCTTGFGRRNKMPEAADLLEWQKKNGVSVSRWASMNAKEREGKYTIGVLHSEEKVDYLTAYDKAVGLSEG